MNVKNKCLVYCAAFVALLCIAGSTLKAQEKTVNQSKVDDFCQNYNDNGNNASVSAVRELTLPAANLLEVNGNRNGGIKIEASNRSDVLIRACVRAWAKTDEAARARANSVRIETSPIVRAATSDGDGEEGLAVSYQIFVPRQTNLKLATYNGGIGISGVNGNIEFDARNGGVSLENLAGDVRGKTRNGGLRVALSGNTWTGAGLDVETINGGVSLSLPATYAARIETGTINGGFRSSIPALQVERKERERAIKLNTDFNGGGAPVRVMTTNGGVKINSNR